MSAEKCQRCKKTDEDLRTVWMSCFYEMDELNIPFDHVKLYKIDAPDAVINGYLLTVCKQCRADWMAVIKHWFNNVAQEKVIGSGIYVRRLGAVIEVTEEEWYRDNPGREPIRMKHE